MGIKTKSFDLMYIYSCMHMQPWLSFVQEGSLKKVTIFYQYLHQAKIPSIIIHYAVIETRLLPKPHSWRYQVSLRAKTFGNVEASANFTCEPTFS